jgi:hypothetical protein
MDLDRLHDIVLPEPVSWTPQTVGWLILLALVLVGVVWLVIVMRRRHRANLYRRLALAELSEIESVMRETGGDAGGVTGTVARLPVLVKKTVLACHPRSAVASLNGEKWLRFLDESYGGNGFTKGPGRILPSLAYARKQGDAPPEAMKELISLIRHWIRRHHVRV